MQLKVAVSSDDHIQGPEDAAVTLVEYGDYECPHCGAAHPIVKRLQDHFRNSVRFVFRNFPLSEMHPMAEPAAETAEFAASQGKFWSLHDAIFEHQSRLSLEYLVRLAQMNGLDGQAAANALEDHSYLERIKHDFAGGARSGVNGTPTFFINGLRHDGSHDYASMVSAIESAQQK